MEDASSMDWEVTPPAAQLNAAYNPAMLERRRPYDEFEIPNIPGGWIDYYTERQFNVEDVVQFRHLARPSIITCAKTAIGQAKRRCVQTTTTIVDYTVRAYQVARSVRFRQAVRRQRAASPRRPSRRVSPRPAPTATLSGPKTSPHAFNAFQGRTRAILTPPDSPRHANIHQTPIDISTPTRPSANTPSTACRTIDLTGKLPDTPPSPYSDLSWDAPSPSHWLNLSYDVSYVDLNSTPPRSSHERQLIAELDDAAGRSSGPSTPVFTAPSLAVTPTKQHPCYLEGDESDFSSHIDISPEYTKLSLDTSEPAEDATEAASEVPLAPTPNITEPSEDATASAPPVPITAIPEDAEDAADFSSYVVVDLEGDLADYSSHAEPDWYQEPALSPYSKNQSAAPRRTTRLAHRLAEEERQRKERQRQINLEKAKITALSEEWEAKVREAVKSGHGPEYNAADFARVVPPQQGGFTDNWLNDESVNGYLKLATKFHNTLHPSTIPKSHAFSSFLLKQIGDKGYAGVQRWAKRAKVGGADLLQTHTIFIPVNNGSHWTLMVVYPGARTAHYYDSMGAGRQGNGRYWFSLVKTWLRGELKEQYNEREWSFYDKASPQQNNSSDCGVFTITTAKMLILGADVLGYGPEDIPVQRKRIVAELVNGGFL